MEHKAVPFACTDEIRHGAGARQVRGGPDYRGADPADPPLLDLRAGQKDLSYPKGYLYGRVDNPTQWLLETTLASLDAGAAAATFALEQAAAVAELTVVPHGHVVLTDDV